MNETFTHIDLFSGIGGFALSARWAGFQTVAFCECEPYAQRVLEKNFGAVMADSDCQRCGKERRSKGGSGACRCSPPALYQDVRTFPGKRYAGATLLTGGFPCQPFSLAGKRAGQTDNRYLWPAMVAVIEAARPTWVIGENVPGIVTMELDNVCADLEAIGYTCWPVIIPACAVDAKHRRDRVWILAHRDSSGFIKRRRSKPIRAEQSSPECAGQAMADAQRQRSGSGLRQVEPEQDGNQPANGSGDVANADCCRYSEWKLGRLGEVCEQRTDQRMQTEKPSEDVPDSRRWHVKRPWCVECGETDAAWWLPEPDVGRVAHGIPNRVDRLKGLGNAIVPQVAAELMRMIVAIERNGSDT